MRTSIRMSAEFTMEYVYIEEFPEDTLAQLKDKARQAAMNRFNSIAGREGFTFKEDPIIHTITLQDLDEE